MSVQSLDESGALHGPDYDLLSDPCHGQDVIPAQDQVARLVQTLRDVPNSRGELEPHLLTRQGT